VNALLYRGGRRVPGFDLAQSGQVQNAQQAAQALGVDTSGLQQGVDGVWDPSTLPTSQLPPGMMQNLQAAATASSQQSAQTAFDSMAASITAAAAAAGGPIVGFAAGILTGIPAVLISLWPAASGPDQCAGCTAAQTPGGCAPQATPLDPMTWDWASYMGSYAAAPTSFEQYLYGALLALYPADGTAIDLCVTPVDLYGPVSPATLVTTLAAAVDQWNATHSATNVSTLSRTGLNRSFASGGAPLTFAPPYYRDPVSYALHAVAVASGLQGPADSAGQHTQGATVELQYNSGPVISPQPPGGFAVPTCQYVTIDLTMSDPTEQPQAYFVSPPWQGMTFSADSTDPTGASYLVGGYYDGSSGPNFSIESTAKFTVNYVSVGGLAPCAVAGGGGSPVKVANPTAPATPSSSTSPAARAALAVGGVAAAGAVAVGAYALAQGLSFSEALRRVLP